MFQNNPSPRNNHIAYIITPNFRSNHIEELTEQLEKNGIPFNIQKQTDTLGQTLNRRLFVVADNFLGPVKLGPEFSSLCMFIVGYPRKGANKKNHYCQNPSSVINKYRQFCQLPQMQKITIQTSQIKSKSHLKSLISFFTRSRISSSLLGSRSNSISQKCRKSTIRLKSIKYYNEEKSKVFLLLAKNEEIDMEKVKNINKYNKYILKIAASDPINFKIIENITEINPYIHNSQSKNHMLVIMESDTEQLPQNYWQNLKITAFCFDDETSKLPKSVSLCHSLTQLVQNIKKEGFEMISLKNDYKSIMKPNVRYSKHGEAISKSKKLIWDQSQKQINLSIDRVSQDFNYRNMDQINESLKTIEISNQEKSKYGHNNVTQQYLLNKNELKLESNSIQSLNQTSIIESKHTLRISLSKIPDFNFTNQEYFVNEKENQPIILKSHIKHKESKNIQTITNNETKKNQNVNKKEQVRKVVKKVKKLKSQTKSRSNQSMIQIENIQKTATPSETKMNEPLKIRKNLLFPQQYYAQASSANLQNQIPKQKQPKIRKISKRVIRYRCLSAQPSFHRINTQHNIVTPLKQFYHLQIPHQGRKVHQIEQSPYFNNNNSKNTIIDALKSQQPKDNSSQGLSYYHMPNKNQISDIFVSTSGSSNDYLLVNSKGSDFSQQFGTVRGRSQSMQLNNVNKIGRQSPFFLTFNHQNQQILEFDAKLSNNKTNQVYKIQTPLCLLWKQFNFDIQQSIHKLKELFFRSVANLTEISFLKTRELEEKLQKLPQNTKVFVMVEDLQLQTYLQAINKFLLNRAVCEIIGIYVYSKVSKIEQNPYFQQNKNPKFNPKSQRLSNINFISTFPKIYVVDDYGEQISTIAQQIIENLVSQNH